MAIDDTPLPRLPRPTSLSTVCSDESYYLAVRAWATGHPDKVVASYLNLQIQALRRLVDTKEWGQVVQLVEEEYGNREFVALTRLHSLALKIVADALERGDPYIDSKTGEVRYKRLTGKDAASIATTLSEQRYLGIKRKAGLPDDEGIDIRQDLLDIAHALRAHRAKDVTNDSTAAPRVPHQAKHGKANSESIEAIDVN